jgi:hypothetical protein
MVGGTDSADSVLQLFLERGLTGRLPLRILSSIQAQKNHCGLFGIGNETCRTCSSSKTGVRSRSGTQEQGSESRASWPAGNGAKRSERRTGALLVPTPAGGAALRMRSHPIPAEDGNKKANGTEASEQFCRRATGADRFIPKRKFESRREQTVRPSR